LTGGVTSAASDLFSLGATLYECLSGLNPFVDRNWRRTLDNTLHKEPRPLAEIVPGLAPEAAEMVGRMLEKKPSQRPGSAVTVADLFEELASSQAFEWLPEPTPGPRRRFRVSTTKSRLLTLDTLTKTLSLGAAPA
jgi:serine/threonine protein kinase